MLHHLLQYDKQYHMEEQLNSLHFCRYRLVYVATRDKNVVSQ